MSYSTVQKCCAVQIISIKVVDEIPHHWNLLVHPFPSPNSPLLCANVYHGFRWMFSRNLRLHDERQQRQIWQFRNKAAHRMTRMNNEEVSSPQTRGWRRPGLRCPSPRATRMPQPGPQRQVCRPGSRVTGMCCPGSGRCVFSWDKAQSLSLQMIAGSGGEE